MFEIPDWEEDVPKDNVKFIWKIKPNKKDVKVTNSSNNVSVVKKVPNLQMVKTSSNSNISQGKKRKLDTSSAKMKKKRNKIQNKEIENYDTDVPDEILLSAKKKKFNETFENDDKEDELFSNHAPKKKPTKVVIGNKSKNIDKPVVIKNNTKSKGNNTISNGNKTISNSKVNLKKEKLKKVLQANSTRNSINVSGANLREKMLETLKAAQFRFLNEKLYTSSGSEAQQLFSNNPRSFLAYHKGYQQQVQKWPLKPLDVIVNRINEMPKKYKVADMGCGKAELSERIPLEVRSFDLVATSAAVEACNMAHTPLLSASMDVVVYCLALMGTDLTSYLVEANRVLKKGRHLLIAEVNSRFDNVDEFTRTVQQLGFKLKNLDMRKMFIFMEFVKMQEAPKKAKLPELTLKPCLYKRR